MPIQNIVDSVIVIEAASPSPAGFGIPLVGVLLTAPQITAWDLFTSDLIVEVAQDTWQDVLASLGFSDGEPLYEWLQAAFSQPIVPAKVLIGREAVKVPQVTNFDLGDAGAAPTGTYTITLSDVDFAEVLGAPSTRAAVVTALIALIDADPLYDAVNGADAEQIDVTAANAGIGFSFAAAAPAPEIWIAGTTTPNEGLSTDLALWDAERADWYLVTELTGNINTIASLGPVVEAFTRDIIAIGSTSTATDADATTGTSSTRGAALLTSFARTGIAHRKSSTSRPLAELLALQLPKDPGATSWSQQEQAVYPGDTWTNTETAALLGQGTDPGLYIYFEKFASRGKGISRNARMGDGTPIDIIRGRDWLNQQIEINVLDQLVDAEKVFYTDAGAQSIVNTIHGTIGSAAPALVVPDSFKVSTTARTDQLPSDIAARVWKGFVWEATLTGAIEAVVIRGKLFITGP